MVTWQNYEEYMMMHADGELKPAEEQALMSFLYEHPELQHELAAFSMTKMIPDTTVTYAGKEKLMKPTGGAKRIAFPVWQRYAVAAGVAALLMVTSYKIYITGNDTTAVAVNTPATAAPATTPAVVPAQPAVARAPKESVAAIVTPEPHIVPARPAKNRQHAVKVRTVSAQQAPAAMAHTAPIERMPAEYIAFANNNEIFLPQAVTNVPPVAIYISEEGKQKHFLDRLPIEDTKKQGIENVATALASGIDKVDAIRQGLNEGFTLKVEKRKLILSF